MRALCANACQHPHFDPYSDWRMDSIRWRALGSTRITFRAVGFLNGVICSPEGSLLLRVLWQVLLPGPEPSTHSREVRGLPICNYGLSLPGLPGGVLRKHLVRVRSF